MNNRYHIPDEVFVVMAVVVQVMTYGLLFFVYPELPERIATHYNLAGQPDAFDVKNIWTVFWPAFLQTFLTALLLFLFRRPQYSHIPGSLFLPLLPAHIRQTIEHVIRHMIVMMLLLLNLIFANVALASVMVAFHYSRGINMIVMGLLLVLLIVLTLEYMILMIRLVKGVMATMMPTRPAPPNTASGK